MKNAWQITDHICQRCLGRVLVNDAVARCADCGLQAPISRGSLPTKGLCTCGAVLRSNQPAGLRCVQNPNGATDECPAEIVVQYVGIEKSTVKQPAPVFKHKGGGLLGDE